MCEAEAVMDSERVWSILRGREGWNERCTSISEFIKHYLDDNEEEDTLAAVRLDEWGWVLWWENERRQQQQRILSFLQTLASKYLYMDHYLLQFWEVVKVEEGQPWHHHLSSSHLPFSVGVDLSKGSCWYRKLCRGHVYVVDMESELGDDDDEAQLMMIGGVGRAYRNKRLESTPDLRLYSTNEFPMRDEAARCGFRGYAALPLFDIPTNQCFGVLELLFQYPNTIENLLSTLNQVLKIAGFKSIHTPLTLGDSTKKKQFETEISEILNLAKATVPRLHLAQVWVPCKQCVNTNTTTNLRCMEIESFVGYKHKRVNCWKDDGDYYYYYDGDGDDDVDGDYCDDDGDYCDDDGDVDDDDDSCWDYVEACKFHNLQVHDSSLRSNLCDLNISKNPLAHYAQRDRMSHSFAISLQSLNESNQVYVFQFYLLRQVSYGGDDSVNLLSRIMEMNLKGFKIESRQTSANAIDCELTDSLQVMNSCYNQHLPELNFTAFLGTLDSCCLRPSSGNNSVRGGWVFRSPGGERLCANGSNSLLFPITVEQKIEDFMKKIVVSVRKHHKWIVQFWAPQTMEGRCYLGTSDQPFAVSCLSKGIASFRKKCMTHYYFVDDEAKQEELGPPGRVFRNRHPEITPDLFLYTTNEFPIRNYAMHSCSGEYFALPVFGDDDELHHKCAGVLEFLGLHYSELGEDIIRTELEAAELFSTHIDSRPRLLSNEQAASTLYCRREAFTELENGLLHKCTDIPQFQMANVWVPNGECVTSIDNNMSCMELALSTGYKWNLMTANQVHWIHVQTRKGFVGMVLASENKSCFCRNLYEFGIADQPLSHYEMSDRRDVCFAICLQSSHTGDLIYVLEFFLYQGPATYEYVRYFLNFLLPIMKHELTSFKLASGKQLGEELVVDVIEFSDANELGSSESQKSDVYPIKFQSVQYSQKGHQHHGEQMREACSIAASCSKTREGGKRKAGLNLSLEILKSHFGKKLKDVAEELGIGKSTIKRACRGYGIDRWPSNKKKLSLLEKECSRGSQQGMLLSTSNLNVSCTNTEEKVMIKVKYEEDIIKFELCLSLGLTKLMEEVARRINVEMGTFKLKYMDEDGDEILLTNDDDLQLCRKTQITADRTYMQLFVR